MTTSQAESEPVEPKPIKSEPIEPRSIKQ
jgi:hypothetical protein